MSEADVMDGAVDSARRTGPMVASRVGEQLARMREEEQRTIAAAEEQRARQLQERFDAQRAAARAHLALTARVDQVGQIHPEMIERCHETAKAWKAYDPEAVQAAGTHPRQMLTRHGIDVHKAGADEASVSAALTRAKQSLAESLEGKGKGDREAANSRLLADKHQATPATAAVAQKPLLARTSKMAKQGSQGKTLERGGSNASQTCSIRDPNPSGVVT